MKYLAIATFFLLTPSAFAAVANVGSSGSFCDPASGTTCNMTITNSGNGTLMLCGIATVNDVSATSLKYNGVSMTLLDSHALEGATNFHIYDYYLETPATGANTLAFVSGSAPNWVNGSCDFFTGENAAAPIDSHNVGGAATTPVTVTATTVANNVFGWVTEIIGTVAGGTAASGPGWTASASSGDTGGNWVANGVIATGGSSLSVSVGRSGNTNNAGAIVGIAPAVVATKTPIIGLIRGFFF